MEEGTVGGKVYKRLSYKRRWSHRREGSREGGRVDRGKREVEGGGGGGGNL